QLRRPKTLASSAAEWTAAWHLKDAVRALAAPAFNLHPRDPRLARWLEDYPPSLFSESLYQSIELMERYSVDLAIDVLDRLNVFERLSQSRSARALCDTLSFPTRFSPTLSWLLRRLIETGCIEVQSEI